MLKRIFMSVLKQGKFQLTRRRTFGKRNPYAMHRNNKNKSAISLGTHSNYRATQSCIAIHNIASDYPIWAATQQTFLIIFTSSLYRIQSRLRGLQISRWSSRMPQTSPKPGSMRENNSGLVDARFGFTMLLTCRVHAHNTQIQNRHQSQRCLHKAEDFDLEVTHVIETGKASMQIQQVFVIYKKNMNFT